MFPINAVAACCRGAGLRLVRFQRCSFVAKFRCDILRTILNRVAQTSQRMVFPRLCQARAK
jgi:hypothetical protein